MSQNRDLLPQGSNATAILVSPRHSAWLTDEDFMASVVKILQAQRPLPAGTEKIWHVLAAVVDGLPPLSGNREMQEGISMQTGTLDGLLPGLWDQESDATAERQPGSAEPGSESACLSVVLRQGKYSGAKITVDLPLANTLFHNGRRTTFLASQWRIFKPERYYGKDVTLLRMEEKRTQRLELLVPPKAQRPTLVSPLVPITYPRRIVEGLGNILAKVEIDGEPSPASKEIQVNVPRLLEARRTWSDAKPDAKPEPARIGVWALIIPEIMMTRREAHGAMADGLALRPSLAFSNQLQVEHLGTALGKLAFEFCGAAERTAWQRCNLLGKILLQGGRLHKIRRYSRLQLTRDTRH